MLSQSKYIKTTPEFDQYLFNHRDEYLFNRRMENKSKLEHGKSILEEKSNISKWSTCGSTNLKKITFTKRAVKTAVFGTLGAIDDTGKTYQCENCGSKF